MAHQCIERTVPGSALWTRVRTKCLRILRIVSRLQALDMCQFTSKFVALKHVEETLRAANAGTKTARDCVIRLPPDTQFASRETLGKWDSDGLKL